ncbi:disease resistance protein RPV1-like [Rhodamnia argentea]|uniref:Disease resistance protein RPV1-like n=1 Tax=Rhodamnia argentea TaxID=178133 RepID=A0ABM3HAW8_9MYRT|nr:disease resistance protein RPV1-like [Rhodamnia argentea]
MCFPSAIRASRPAARCILNCVCTNSGGVVVFFVVLDRVWSADSVAGAEVDMRVESQILGEKLGAESVRAKKRWIFPLSKRTSSLDCEVFLSCADARKGFADRLYGRLVGVGIRVFRDHAGEKLRPEVLKAIKNGKILIPIISENYASSKSCLDQLVHMMERQKHSGRRLVFPIFYKVKAADVRKRRGSFGEAFRCYRRSFDGKVVAEWNKALEEVSKLTTGWESERVADGREEELVKLVAKQVSQELKRQYLVGIDSRVDEVMQLIDERSSATVIVGIYGRVGIGKTTLVKAIDKKLSGSSYWRSFIADIRESCNRNAKKALIILDDVDNTKQLNDLVGMSHLLAPGSRIFFTTRNESVLGWAKVDRKYELKELNEEQRLILFSRHAFRRDSPPNEFSALARRVVSITGGLPLALKGVGSFLCRKPAKVWEETIRKMENIPYRKVQERLLSDVNLTGDFRSLFSELRWLKRGNCPSEFEATKLQAERLVILDLSGSKISDNWRGWPSLKMARELKVLNLTGCRSLKSTSYLSAFKRLEILILRDCSELKGIHPCIGDMKNLVSLDLRGCSRLTELPPEMAKLGRLEELHLDGTGIREIPSFMRSLKKLKTRSAS